jgi:hypothetical protein
MRRIHERFGFSEHVDLDGPVDLADDGSDDGDLDDRAGDREPVGVG